MSLRKKDIAWQIANAEKGFPLRNKDLSLGELISLNLIGRSNELCELFTLKELLELRNTIMSCIAQKNLN